jgi:hypothetical protein
LQVFIIKTLSASPRITGKENDVADVELRRKLTRIIQQGVKLKRRYLESYQ